jgi:hypothetical protein
MSTIFIFIQRPHPQAADMARPVVARRNTFMHNWTRADPANLCILWYNLLVSFVLGLSYFHLLSLSSSAIRFLLLCTKPRTQIPCTQCICPTSSSPSNSASSHLSRREVWSAPHVSIASPSDPSASSLALSLTPL